MKYLISIAASVLILAGCSKSPEQLAYNAAMEHVKKYLKAPSTAKFQPFEEVHPFIDSKGDMSVLMWCEASNAMGVPIRSSVTVQFDGPTAGNVIRSSMDGQVLHDGNRTSVVKRTPAEMEALANHIADSLRAVMVQDSIREVMVREAKASH